MAHSEERNRIFCGRKPLYCCKSGPRQPCTTGTAPASIVTGSRFLRRNYRVLPVFRNLPRCTVTPLAIINKRHLTHIAGISQTDSPMVSHRKVTARRKLCREIVRSSRYWRSGGPNTLCSISQVCRVGEERKLKKTASSKKGVVGRIGRKTPANANSTLSNAPILTTALSTGLAINIPDDGCWRQVFLSMAAYTTTCYLKRGFGSCYSKKV